MMRFDFLSMRVEIMCMDMTVAIPVSKAGGTVTSATMRLIAFINSAQLMLCDRIHQMAGKMRLVKVSTSNPSTHDIFSLLLLCFLCHLPE